MLKKEFCLENILNMLDIKDIKKENFIIFLI